MGFEPIFDASGNWTLGRPNANNTLNKVWSGNIGATYSNSFSYTIPSSQTYATMLPANVLTANRIYLITFAYDATGNPWILRCTFFFTPVIKNGDSAQAEQFPFYVHADNGTTFYLDIKTTDSSGHISAGIQFIIAGQSGRVGTAAVTAYDWGSM